MLGELGLEDCIGQRQMEWELGTEDLEFNLALLLVGHVGGFLGYFVL